jgi:iron complex transport system substrate-binding protein
VALGVKLLGTIGITKIQAALIIAIIVLSVIGVSFLAIRSAQSISSGPNTIVDMAGRNVQIPSLVNRVVILNSYWNEIACNLGAADKIVGIDKYSTSSYYIPLKVKNLTVVGDLFNGINLETLIALKPDLVIMDYGYGKTGEIITTLEGLNISVVALVCNNFNDQVNAIRILGKVLNAEKSAGELANFMESQHSALLSTAVMIPASEKPKVLVCKLDVWGQGLIYTYANSTYGTLVENLGGINIALRDFPDQSWPKVSMEKLLAWDPDIIIVLGYDNATLSSQLNSMGNSTWDQLKAVKDGKVYPLLVGSKVAGAYLDWGPRMIIGEMQIAKIIQPSYFADLNISGAIDTLFTQFYNAGDLR